MGQNTTINPIKDQCAETVNKNLLDIAKCHEFSMNDKDTDKNKMNKFKMKLIIAKPINMSNTHPHA